MTPGDSEVKDREPALRDSPVKGGGKAVTAKGTDPLKTDKPKIWGDYQKHLNWCAVSQP